MTDFTKEQFEEDLIRIKLCYEDRMFGDMKRLLQKWDKWAEEKKESNG